MNQIRELRIFHFEVFVAVAALGSFTAAAKALEVSRSGVSKALTEYERQLGYALFERDTRNVNITPAGAQLLPSMRALLRFCHDRHDGAEAVAHAKPQERQGSTQADLQAHLRRMRRAS